MVIEKILMFCFIQIFVVAGGLYFTKKELDKKDKKIEEMEKEIVILKENEEKCRVKVLRIKRK